MSITRLTLSEIVERMHTLPVLPEVVASIGRLLNDPAVTATQIAELVSRDPGISAKVLRIVNSPVYGRTIPVRDLTQAVSLIGMKALRSLVVSLSVVESCALEQKSFDLRAFWLHSVVGASLARNIAICTKIEDPELCYLVGLLRNIGRLVMAQNLPKETSEIVAIAREFHLPFHSAAREVLTTDDSALGAWVSEHWGLEKPLVEGIRYQRESDMSPNPRLPALLSLVEFLCYSKNIRGAGDHHKLNTSADDILKLGLNGPALQGLLDGLDNEVAVARNLLASGA